MWWYSSFEVAQGPNLSGTFQQALRINKYDDDPIGDEYSQVEWHGLPAPR